LLILVILDLEMANLTNEEVLALAHLARLDLSDDETMRFRQEISKILGYVEQLQSVKIKDKQPTYQVTGLTNVMRPDELIAYTANPKELLKNAPATDGGHIKVKRVL
jgi:aspartyl-tRNA(Asn)/glutamyl-tRNA(Gln) amidotransferase subunit C